MLLFLTDLINIENLRISFRLFYSLSFIILLLFTIELHHSEIEKLNQAHRKTIKAQSLKSLTCFLSFFCCFHSNQMEKMFCLLDGLM